MRYYTPLRADLSFFSHPVRVGPRSGGGQGLHAHLRTERAAAGLPAQPGRREEMALEVFKDVCCALKHCHELGVAHRDVKQENVRAHSPAAGSPVKCSQRRNETD